MIDLRSYVGTRVQPKLFELFGYTIHSYIRGKALLPIRKSIKKMQRLLHIKKNVFGNMQIEGNGM